MLSGGKWDPYVRWRRLGMGEELGLEMVELWFLRSKGE